MQSQSHFEMHSPQQQNSDSPDLMSASSPDLTAHDAALETRLAASIDRWKRKLLDLTKRNRALNFRHQKVSTVAIVDEQPAEIFRQLYIREQQMRFKAAAERTDDQSSQPPAHPETSTESESTIDLWKPPATQTDVGGVSLTISVITSDGTTQVESDVPLSGFEEEDLPPASDFAPYDPAVLDERHTDDWLQTTAMPDALDRSLRRLDEQARLSLEEQGVNTLFLALGMLHYSESEDSEQIFRAPLVLLPVELSRRSARSGFSVKAGDDEPMVNPALGEYLQQFGIALPMLPDPNSITDAYDLQEFMTLVRDAVSARTRWNVTTEVYLGLFSFQKFVMYKDLEANTKALNDHRLVRQLISRRSSSDQVVGLPTDIARMELDRDYPPESTYQVVDADSSQLRAIAAVSRQHDLVIEGPPGTGKSQTITNLIASALAAGKSVLFVAEKMAALSVVHDRLQSAKLGEFCLELHSTKANKRAVMKELAATLDASLQQVAASTVSTQRLPEVRTTLTAYAEAVHAPLGSLGISPYRVFGLLGALTQAPRITYDGPVDGDVTSLTVESTVRALRDLQAAAQEIGVPAQHPWRDANRTFYSEDQLLRAKNVATKLQSLVHALEAQAATVADAFTLPRIDKFADASVATAVAGVLSRSPGAPEAILRSEAWNQPPADATRLIEDGEEVQKLNDRVARIFLEHVLEQDHAADIAYVEQKAQGLLSFLALLDGRYRAIKRRWLAYRKPSYQPTLIDQANELRHVDRLRAARVAMNEKSANGRELFGLLWQGDRSDWKLLRDYVAWVVEFRGVCVRHGLAGRSLDVATQATPDVSAIAELERLVSESRRTLEELATLVGWPPGYLADAPLSVMRERARSLDESLHRAPEWAAFEAARQVAAGTSASDVLHHVMSGEFTFEQLPPAFLRAFYMKWMTWAVQSRPVLERFATLSHEQRVREFQELDQRVLLENRAALVGMLRDRAQHALRQEKASNELPYLRRELARQRGLSPLRRTLQQAGTAIRGIKPCFMMSPLTVAQLLDGGAPTFDLVIFDEASQLPAEDAVGSVIRGHQLVVVGDPKQLPPTNFFSVSSGTSSAALGEDGLPLVEDSESILEEYMGAGVPMSRLKWHYRSAHESLISFSNTQFYESDLYTFPSVETGNDNYGLQFEYIAEGVYEGRGLNPIEARRVADEIVRFAKEQFERRAAGEQTQTLGVGTFNLRQQLAIQDELEQRRRDDPSIEPFFDRSLAEPFFVKNLENIQGDERDVIFLSVTYAKGLDGRLRHMFGPLNGVNGWRRLNVLTTRARQRMRVFSSMRGDEISAAATTSQGAALLRDFLKFAEHGQLQSVSTSLAADTESPFERDVLTELMSRGYKAVPQVGVAGYRIDLGVLDDEAPGRFLCGIECDGVAYHSSETARDRDRLRQQVLEARGWSIIRVWSTDWFKDRVGQIARLERYIEAERLRSRSDSDALRNAQARLAAQRAELAREADAAAAVEAQQLAASFGAGATYARPTAPPYQFAAGEGKFASFDILDAPMSQLVAAARAVVNVEAPIHETDLMARVAGFWGSRLGSRITARLKEVLSAETRAGHFRRRGEFFWGASDEVQVRSRAGTRMPAERVPPEEYQAAIRLVLADGHGLSRQQLLVEVRSVLGYGRMGPALEEAISAAIELLLASGVLGEGSAGFRLRRQSS